MDVAVKAEKQGQAGRNGPFRSSRRSASSGPDRWAAASPTSSRSARYDVVINDIRKEAVDKALATIERNMGRQVATGVVKEADAKSALDAHQRSRRALNPSATCDLVIEAATEDEALKRQDFPGAVSELKPTALLATNTSSISITRLASTTDRPEHFIGMHFMNPVPLMELVELIRGIATEDERVRGARNFVESLGKTTAVSEDFPAFIVNRILLPMINEAVYTLYEGVGTVEGIDKAMRLGAHHPMGPLELADFIGLDTCLVGDAGALRRPVGLQVPPLPAAGEIRRGRLARPQDQARLLRLPRREAGPDALSARRPHDRLNQVAIVTGAGSGIGRVVALALQRNG